MTEGNKKTKEKRRKTPRKVVGERKKSGNVKCTAEGRESQKRPTIYGKILRSAQCVVLRSRFRWIQAMARVFSTKWFLAANVCVLTRQLPAARCTLHTIIKRITNADE